MSKTKIFLLLVSAWIWVGIVFAQTGPAGWKGKIVDENGIKTIKNPEQPLYGDFVFDLEKDLAIGGDPAKEEYYFPKGTYGLTVDNEGNLFVSDSANVRVQEFDKSGKYVRTIGRKGQGPGEFRFPGRLQIDGLGRLCVFESRAVQLFDKNGGFVSKIPLSSPNSPFLSSSGVVFGMEFISQEPGAYMEALKKMEPNDAQPKTIARFKGEFKEGQTVWVRHVYTSKSTLTPLDASNFAYGFSAEYRIYLADAAGRTTLIVEKPANPQEISAAEKSWIREKSPILADWNGPVEDPRKEMIFPEKRPLFERLLSDDLGRIYALEIQPVLEPESPYRADVFSRDGVLLYRLSISVKPFLIKSGFLYEVRKDKDTDEFQVIRYRIKNWASLK
jgi:hypothetical protein